MNIILCGIVRDEADNIVRTLDSFKPIADKVILTDTGSTDGTPELIEKWLRDNQIVGMVYRCPWNELAAAAGIPPRADGSPALFDFARARNTAVALAMQHSEDPANDWIGEADATWQLRGQVHRLRGALEQAPAELTGYELMVNQTGASSVPYLRLRRVRECGQPGKNWVWRGRIHEYLWRPDNAVTGRIEGIWIDHEDTEQSAANRRKRFERDIQIFDEEIAAMTARGVQDRPPGDHERGELTRAYFYRAQSYENLGRLEEAYADYETRAKMQGAVQEWASACYRCGRLAWKRHDRQTAMRWFLEAFAVGGRPEGLWAYADVVLNGGDILTAQDAARIAYDVAKAQKLANADGFGYPEAFALATPGPARDHQTIAARIKQLGLLGVPYPAAEK